MNINEICNKVCGKLKVGWKINIGLENGAGWVELIDPTGHYVDFDSSDMSIEEQIDLLTDHSHELPE